MTRFLFLAMALFCLPVHAQSGDAILRFVALGDLPYGPPEVAQAPYRGLIDRINAVQPGFSIHVGDFKSGSTPCSDEEFSRQLENFQRFAGALIYTPGDNEWTDTHSEKAGRFEPRERLARIRELFFAEERSRGGRPLPLVTQRRDPAHARFVENARWTIGGVMFATVHVVGSHNNHQPKVPGALEEWRERDAANAAWVRDVFAAAKSGAAPGVALFFQANPIGAGREGKGEDPGFELFLTTIENEARAFGRPVLLVHADEHTYRMEPGVRLTARGKPMPNITRLETFGGQDFHAVLVVVDPASAAVFAAGPLIVPGNPSPKLLRAPAPKS